MRVLEFAINKKGNLVLDRYRLLTRFYKLDVLRSIRNRTLNNPVSGAIITDYHKGHIDNPNIIFKISAKLNSTISTNNREIVYKVNKEDFIISNKKLGNGNYNQINGIFEHYKADADTAIQELTGTTLRKVIQGRELHEYLKTELHNYEKGAIVPIYKESITEEFEYFMKHPERFAANWNDPGWSPDVAQKKRRNFVEDDLKKTMEDRYLFNSLMVRPNSFKDWFQKNFHSTYTWPLVKLALIMAAIDENILYQSDIQLFYNIFDFRRDWLRYNDQGPMTRLLKKSYFNENRAEVDEFIAKGTMYIDQGPVDIGSILKLKALKGKYPEFLEPIELE